MGFAPDDLIRSEAAFCRMKSFSVNSNASHSALKAAFGSCGMAIAAPLIWSCIICDWSAAETRDIHYFPELRTQKIMLTIIFAQNQSVNAAQAEHIEEVP